MYNKNVKEESTGICQEKKLEKYWGSGCNHRCYCWRNGEGDVINVSPLNPI